MISTPNCYRMREGSVASGKDEVRNTLENLKPKQAKALILEMLNKKEIDDVVTLLSPMPDAKRAKIFGEFKTDEEMEQLSEVLRRIRIGSPTANVPENTRQQLEQLKTTQHLDGRHGGDVGLDGSGSRS